MVRGRVGGSVVTRRALLLYLVLPLAAAGIALLFIGASMHVRAAGGHAPSRFHRIYPPERSTPATGSGVGSGTSSSRASTRSGTSSLAGA